MNASFRKLVATFGALVLALVCSPRSWAGCAPSLARPTHSSWFVQPGGPTLLQAALVNDDRDDNPSIVGMWHVTFTAKTMNGAPISDMVVDDALVVWHSDHTEIMNSGRPPQDGDFCMGVWEQEGKYTYKLNHFTWGGNDYDPKAPPETVGPHSAGPTHITESVTLNRDGNHFSGTFTLDAPDTNNVVTSFTGALTATRITMQTTAGDL
ncbi:MAG TPA: hypothetical protein VGM02_10160 [Acidobacteriaceae bacterium]|jgi:hypothetical protein